MAKSDFPGWSRALCAAGSLLRRSTTTRQANGGCDKEPRQEMQSESTQTRGETSWNRPARLF